MKIINSRFDEPKFVSFLTGNQGITEEMYKNAFNANRDLDGAISYHILVNYDGDRTSKELMVRKAFERAKEFSIQHGIANKSNNDSIHFLGTQGELDYEYSISSLRKYFDKLCYWNTTCKSFYVTKLLYNSNFHNTPFNEILSHLEKDDDGRIVYKEYFSQSMSPYLYKVTPMLLHFQGEPVWLEPSHANSINFN